jgi:GTPase
VGVLATGELDNGRGRARLHCFTHTHEIKSGRTSSVGHHVVGFDAAGHIVNYDAHGQLVTPEEVSCCLQTTS